MTRHVDPSRLAAPYAVPRNVGGSGGVPDHDRATDWLDLLRQEADGLSGWSLERLIDRLEDRG